MMIGIGIPIARRDEAGGTIYIYGTGTVQQYNIYILYIILLHCTGAMCRNKYEGCVLLIKFALCVFSLRQQYEITVCFKSYQRIPATWVIASLRQGHTSVWIGSVELTARLL